MLDLKKTAISVAHYPSKQSTASNTNFLYMCLVIRPRGTRYINTEMDRLSDYFERPFYVPKW